MKTEILGVLELGSIADGLAALDAMVKAAPVTVLRAGSVNPGKFLILVGGDVASVEYSMDRGIEAGSRSVLDHLILKNIDPGVVSALEEKNEVADMETLGILETLSITASIEAADMAVKATGVDVVEIQSGHEMGGRAALKIAGSLGEVEDAMRVMIPFVRDKKQYFSDAVISSIHGDVKGFVYGN